MLGSTDTCCITLPSIFTDLVFLPKLFQVFSSSVQVCLRSLLSDLWLYEPSLAWTDSRSGCPSDTEMMATSLPVCELSYCMQEHTPNVPVAH